MTLDYLINPVIMGGIVKDVYEDGTVKIYLNGRLGVIKVNPSLLRGDITPEPGHTLEFYFSYMQMLDEPYDYDASDMTPDHDIEPCLLGGTIIDVNDTAVTVAVMDRIGEITVPRRWLITSKVPENGCDVEFYFSCINVTGKRDLPKQFI